MFSQHLHKACVKFTDTNKDILNPFSNHDMNPVLLHPFKDNLLVIFLANLNNGYKKDNSWSLKTSQSTIQLPVKGKPS